MIGFPRAVRRSSFHNAMPSRPSSSETMARRAAALATELKATDVVILDLRHVTDMADFFVIASGTSDTHVRAVAQHVMDEMKQDGMPVQQYEGVTQGKWALLDFVDCVVHVFHPALRQFYQLERLWSDATPLAMEPVAEGA